MKVPRKVYAIQHNVTKRIYIGSSARPGTRYMAHINLLRNGKHKVEVMQMDFDQYGESYSFFILDEIQSYEDRLKEYAWMRKYKTYDKRYGYNYKDQAVVQIFGDIGPHGIPYKDGIPEPVDMSERSSSI